MQKICFKCGEIKPLEQFYRHPMMADGHLNKYKRCARIDARTRRMVHRDYYNRYDAERYKRLKRWPTREVEKRKASAMINIRVQRGTMIRPTRCSQYGSSDRIEGHHDDYSKPLHVRWLCHFCHSDHHAKEKLRK